MISVQVRVRVELCGKFANNKLTLLRKLLGRTLRMVRLLKCMILFSHKLNYRVQSLKTKHAYNKNKNVPFEILEKMSKTLASPS